MAEITRKVVIAADLSEHSDYAFDWYLAHFHKPENHVMVVTCPEFYVGPSDMSTAKIEEIIEESNAKTDQLKNKFLLKMNENNVTGEFIALDDTKVGRAICEFAKKIDASYVVTGTRGQGKVRRTLLGSVSDYIIHHSHSPVLVCRAVTHHDEKHHHHDDKHHHH